MPGPILDLLASDWAPLPSEIPRPLEMTQEVFGQRSRDPVDGYMIGWFTGIFFLS
jgi:hypothetical protein